MPSDLDDLVVSSRSYAPLSMLAYSTLTRARVVFPTPAGPMTGSARSKDDVQAWRTKMPARAHRPRQRARSKLMSSDYSQVIQIASTSPAFGDGSLKDPPGTST